MLFMIFTISNSFSILFLPSCNIFKSYFFFFHINEGIKKPSGESETYKRIFSHIVILIYLCISSSSLTSKSVPAGISLIHFFYFFFGFGSRKNFGSSTLAKNRNLVAYMKKLCAEIGTISHSNMKTKISRIPPMSPIKFSRQ
jgi:hypothetical protein